MSLPSWRQVPIISGRTARRMLEAGFGALEVSLDLGRTETAISVEADEIVLPDARRVKKAALAEVSPEAGDCIELAQGGCEKVYLYSDAERKYYKLYQPFEGRAPTIVINNAPMHAIVRKDPWQDEADKVATLPRRRGECLDTCCGLGYSAQLLADAGFARVTSCEVDLNVLGIAAINPWSGGLFKRPKIALLNVDLRELVAGCPAGRFSCVFHDPPTIFQAGELYSEALYREFAAVLARGGVLYHYVGSPGRRSGRDYARGVMRRMHAAGFIGVRRVTGGVLGVLSR